MGHPVAREDLGIWDPLRMGRIYGAIERSNRFLSELPLPPDRPATLQATVIDALGNDFRPSNRFGSVNIARCIFENAELSSARAALGKYDALLVASRWNAQLIERATGRAAKVIFEGVDPSLFCPGPKSGLMNPDQFYVYSGGKVEFRKAQDLVLLAFRQFHARHPDAVLVTAWHSPWPRLSAGFKGRLTVPVDLDGHGMLDIAKWVHQNGLDPKSVLDLGFVPNAAMPAILREMDVALQPSRAEACTNLPVSEAMACAVPVIAAPNSGMTDLLNDENCILLRKQSRVDAEGSRATDGWGESDVDEIVAALEFAHEHREQARQIGIRSREWLIEHGRTWQAHANELKGWILSIQ